MATNAQWTVVFEDKLIIKQSGDGAGTGYPILDNDSFWSDSKWSNIWAIQYKDDDLDYNDSVEYRDGTPHATWNEAGLGDFRSQFISKWDSGHLTSLQNNWDSDVLYDAEHQPVSETDEEKIARLGPRPTSYSS
jgi:hypothetical protein